MAPTTKKICIGIDFGTSYVSVSYVPIDPSLVADALQQSLDRSRINTLWFRQSDCIPAVLAWDDAEGKWIIGQGIQIKRYFGKIKDEYCFFLMKLGLDRRPCTQKIRDRLNWQISNLPEVARAQVKSIEALVETFLGLLYAEVKIKLDNILSHDETTIETAVSVPAAWDFGLRHKIVAIAQRAGLDNVTTPVHEPDSAALVLRYDEPRHVGGDRSFECKSQSPFVVVDMGGGTVDLVTFKSKNGSFLQSSAPTGGLHGSSWLNEYFYELFKSKLGNRYFDLLGTWIELKEQNIPPSQNPSDQDDEESIKRRAKDSLEAYVKGQFEEAKMNMDQSFEDNLKEDFEVTMPRIQVSYPHTGLHRGAFTIPKKDVIKVFSRILIPIRELTEGHLQEFEEMYGKEGATLRTLFFVGRPSSNTYLKRKLQDMFPGLRVITPAQDSAHLISKGTLMRTINRDAIKSSVMSCSIGSAWEEKYDEKIHGTEETPVKSPADGSMVVPARMKWLFRKREILEPGATRYFEGEHYIQTRDHLSALDAKNDPNVRFGADIHPIGFVRLKITKREMGQFPRKWNRGRSWYTFIYRLRITYLGPIMKYEFIIPRKGVIAPDNEEEWTNNSFSKDSALELDAFFDQKNRLSPDSQGRNQFLRSDDHDGTAEAATFNQPKKAYGRRIPGAFTAEARYNHQMQIPETAVGEEEGRPQQNQKSDPGHLQTRSQTKQSATQIQPQANDHDVSQRSSRTGVPGKTLRHPYISFASENAPANKLTKRTSAHNSSANEPLQKKGKAPDKGRVLRC
ncbi:uncharacterized protein KY384_007266 [Bacidia gigantensis]|uniref:uncharacterized protein n=1 Tax=Bacidia gigantensis TaxID=2732470 RepID=UPI001D03CE41|nr:uncharacterized protein KY384_007266 [Bacidia gigantensis]KAG8528348.1 hypothetical protein KY384_007266 [Bacidia gigantensis]